MTRHRPDHEPPLDSDEELETLDESPGARLAYIRRRLIWMAVVAALCVGALLIVERLGG